MRATTTGLVLAACAGLLAPGAPADARHVRHRGADPHRARRGEATFPITAGSSRVLINAVGEVITSEDGRGRAKPARANKQGK